MKAFAHLSPTVPAMFVAAMAISLSVFLLPGAVVQGEPTPLSAVFAGAAGRVAADLPAAVVERASEPARRAASSAQLAATRSEQLVPQRAHRRARSRVVQRAPAAPAPPAATRLSFSSPTTVTSRVHGHGRARRSAAIAPVPGAHGHGKAFERSSEHHHGLPRGHAKKAPTAPASAPTTPPNGGANGHKGGKK
jgi:hypothetical protein